ncbi:MurR/RpiR family transcriptional regulator [Lachnospiraceae bacterium LCP25S3_G4]
MKALREAIRNATLTKTEGIIADFMLDNYAEACFMTSTDIALRLNVSESSVIRFCRTLGFKGYMDFQKMLQKHYQKKVNSISRAITTPADRLEELIVNSSEDSYIETHFQNVLSNLESAIINNRQELYDKAADIIIRSKQKFIIASRMNTGQGDFFYMLMKHMVDNVHSASYGAVSTIDHISDITSEDCLILFSFPRYSQMDKLALELALEVGAKIVVITDKQSSLPAQYATVLLTVNIDSNTFFNSYVGVQFVTETLCDTISYKVGKPIGERLKRIDKYLEPLGVY